VSSLLYALGRWSYRSRKLVLVLWIAVLALAGGSAALFNQGTDNAFSIPGTESQEALDTLSSTFPQVSGASAQIIVTVPEGDDISDQDVKDAVKTAVDDLGDSEQVAAATDPFGENAAGAIADNDRAALISVQMDVGQSEVTATAKSDLEKITDQLNEALPQGAKATLGGSLFATELPTVTITEGVGLVVALVVLVLTFGSFLAAGMPLLSAILGVGISIALIFVATIFGPISSTTPLLALMLGLAVGIDYALFIISRHQDQLRQGMQPEESAARAVATAGSAVIFAGLTVVIALLGLSVAGIPFLTTMGTAAAVAVALAVCISLTLIPALLGFAKGRINPNRRALRKQAQANAEAGAASHGTDRSDVGADDSSTTTGSSDTTGGTHTGVGAPVGTHAAHPGADSTAPAAPVASSGPVSAAAASRADSEPVLLENLFADVDGDTVQTTPGRSGAHAAAIGTPPAAASARPSGSPLTQADQSRPAIAPPPAPGPSDQAVHHQNKFFNGWVRAVTRFPLLTIVLVVGILGLAAVPALQLRLGLPDAGSLPASSSARQAYDLIGENFGEGKNGPLIVTGSIVTSTDPVGLMNDIADEIRGMDGVDSVPLATPNETADTGIIQVVPTGGPDSQSTKDLVADLRAQHDHFEDKYGVDLAVTGTTAAGIDVSDRLGAALLPFGILVVGLSLILLTMVFRSIWVPIKATLGYLLSVIASFGAVAAVFEWGWFGEALHVEQTGPVISFMPIILMGVLFGLAMDYEVFLVARMREDYVHGKDARKAVTTGFVGSAKVVTAAAVIMFAVFAAFVPEGDTSIKPIALGLAVGVFVDAFIVRMTLVPAVLALLGERAWWLPKWLDRALPSFDVEGEGLQRELDLANWPAPGSTDVVVADRVGLKPSATAEHALFHDLSFVLPASHTLVVHGEHPAAVRALLLTISGRAKPDEGTLKVAGLVSPIRATTIRSRVAFLTVDDSVDAVGRIRDIVDEQPALLVIDGIDRLTDHAARKQVFVELSEAQASAARRDATLTLAVGTVEEWPLSDAIPAGDGFVDVSLETSRTRTTNTAEVPA
jgi:RND superfamily putative drug exporter